MDTYNQKIKESFCSKTVRKSTTCTTLMTKATKIEKHHASIEEQLQDSLKHLSSRIDNIV